MAKVVSSYEALFSLGYQFIKEIGEGKYSKVFLCTYSPSAYPHHRFLVACKMIETWRAPREFVVKFIPREISIIMNLQHPNIVQTYSLIQSTNRIFIFMNYAENGDLLRFILQNGVLVEDQARVWFRQIVSAVQYLHSNNIAHRDLKCENILITAHMNVQITDFGFARYILNNMQVRVLSNTFCGSLAYAAPEVILGKVYDPQMVDFWSMGVILYAMTNKALPFASLNMIHMYHRQISRSWKFRPYMENRLSHSLKVLINGLLEPDVSRRYTAHHIKFSDWFNRRRHSR